MRNGEARGHAVAVRIDQEAPVHETSPSEDMELRRRRFTVDEYYAFYGTAGDRAVISVQDPIRLHARTEPQPDLALLRPRSDFYAAAHATPEDVLLVVEVADTSEAYDRRVKFPRYAQAGIPEAWLLSRGLRGNAVRLEVRREPSPQGYRRVQRFGRGERLTPVALPDVDLAVTELLGE